MDITELIKGNRKLQYPEWKGRRKLPQLNLYSEDQDFGHTFDRNKKELEEIVWEK